MIHWKHPRRILWLDQRGSLGWTTVLFSHQSFFCCPCVCVLYALYVVPCLTLSWLGFACLGLGFAMACLGLPWLAFVYLCLLLLAFACLGLALACFGFVCFVFACHSFKNYIWKSESGVSCFSFLSFWIIFKWYPQTAIILPTSTAMIHWKHPRRILWLDHWGSLGWTTI